MADISLKIEGLDRIKIGFKNFEKFLLNSRVLLQTAADVRNIVVKRTLKGLDADLKPFKPYSTQPLYLSADHRPKPQGGRRTSKSGKPMKTVFYEGGYAQFARETKGSGSPDLFASGDMFRSFQVQSRQTRGTRARILFTRRFPAIKAAGNNAKRKFVGVHPSEEAIVQKGFARRVNRELKRAKLI